MLKIKLNFLIRGVFLFLSMLFSSFCNSENLSTAYKKFFSIGVAVSNSDMKSEEIKEVIQNNFDSVTHEFAMKWSQVEIKAGVYDFSLIDSFVEHAILKDKKVIGHTLVWHKANPDWIFKHSLINKSEIRDLFLNKLRLHISTMVGRYRGKIYGWDVVNEAFDYDGSYRKTEWLNFIGEDYIEKSFEYAHQADPTVKLFYNDYGLVHKPKQDAVISLIKRLQEKNIPIHAVGIQGHYSLTYPDLDKLNTAINRFAELGVKVMISELDVSVLPFPGIEERGEDAKISINRAIELNPYSEYLPSKVQEEFDRRYIDLFCVFIKNKQFISRVSFWGVSDTRSWRNNWPLKNRVDYPLLYGRDNKPKILVGKLIRLAILSDKYCSHIV